MESDQDGNDLGEPMNAFLSFCQQHKSFVRDKFPSIEPCAVTKYLSEWWSRLQEEEKSPYTSIPRHCKEAFMKANPDIGWHKMPPGSADSMPPSNAKPSTPTNGVTCPMSSLLTGSSYASEMAGNDSPSQPSAPKPFKKRYLASQQSQSPSEGNLPSQSINVSPEAARACEALLEMARTESQSSDGSDKRVSPSDTPPLQTLREAVWSKVAGTLLKQEEDKLVPPPKDCPMNLTNQCTIRGQQIIEHIIENILNMPMEGPMDPSSEPITFSLNNNQEQPLAQSSAPPAVEVADSIKASIYESLKVDLLKKSKVSTPVSNSPVTGGNRTINSAQLLGTPPSTPPSVSPGQSTTMSPPIALSRRPQPPKKVVSPVRVPVASPAPAPIVGQDVLRLLGAGQMSNISVGNVGNITITKTPRPPAGAPPTIQSFSSPAASSSSPVLSLTRSSNSQVFNLNSGTGTVPLVLPVSLSGHPGVVLTSGPSRQSGVVISPQHGHGQSGPVVLTTGQNGLLLSGHHQTSGQNGLVLSGQTSGQNGLVLSGQTTGPNGLVLSGQSSGQNGLVLSGHPQTSVQNGLVLSSQTTGQNGLVLSGQTNGQNGLVLSGHSQTGGQMVITQPPLILAGLPGGQLVLSPQHSPVNRSPHDTTDPVNLTTAASPHRQEKRPLSEQDEEDIRRSSRAGRGRRYQEFIEDGRISLGGPGKKVRRSHRSGEVSESESDHKVVPLTDNTSTEDHSVNHWKKKMRTASLGENTHSISKPPEQHITANPLAATKHDLDWEQDQLDKLKSSKTAPRTSRQSGPSSPAFDARLNRKTREKF